MLLFKGDMTLADIDKLAVKGYVVEIDADSEYMNVTKAPIEPVEAILEVQG